MDQVTVMFEIDQRLLEVLRQEAGRCDVSEADILRSALCRHLLAQPQSVVAPERHAL